MTFADFIRYLFSPLDQERNHAIWWLLGSEEGAEMFRGISDMVENEGGRLVLDPESTYPMRYLEENLPVPLTQGSSKSCPSGPPHPSYFETDVDWEINDSDLPPCCWRKGQ
jgi:hypothetical protein